jgi:hypothetical protein
MTDKLTKEYIVALLARKDNVGMNAVGRALGVLLDRQTEAEKASFSTQDHNDIGFTGAHAKPMTGMALFYRERGYLTPKQLSWLQGETTKRGCRIAMYWKQLLEVAKEKQGR